MRKCSTVGIRLGCLKEVGCLKANVCAHIAPGTQSSGFTGVTIRCRCLVVIATMNHC